jgi:hypothetical protein
MKWFRGEGHWIADSALQALTQALQPHLEVIALSLPLGTDRRFAWRANCRHRLYQALHAIKVCTTPLYQGAFQYAKCLHGLKEMLYYEKTQ